MLKKVSPSLILIITFLNFFILLLLSTVYWNLLTQKLQLEDLIATYQASCTQLNNRLKDIQSYASSCSDEESTPDENFIILNRDPAYREKELFIQETAALVAPQANPKKRALQARKKGKNTKDMHPPHQHLELSTNVTIMAWPIEKDKFWISSYYGFRNEKRFHYGLDLAAPHGTPVKAAASGKVEFSGHAGTFGLMILLKHSHHHKTRYAHLSDICVGSNQKVHTGQVIGYVGNTGRVSGKNGNHLHFEVLCGGKPVDPLNFL